ncbi:MAG: UPF0489 family protein [Clostridiales bacterium]|nr:UPF0489 family protein [Clostridiales bacterium]
MNVLDIDLDFFLADVCPLALPGERPALKGHEPWEEARVRRFLEENCGLSRSRPIPGRIFETHDLALDFWQDMLSRGRLTAPFRVTHVDAHSDLGVGQTGYALNALLALPPEKRTDIALFRREGHISEANYLLFALAARRISRLDNVRNPRSLPDVPEEILDGNGIRLSSFVARLLEKKHGPEPLVPFVQYPDCTSFKASAPFDCVSVAVSPRYAPREADRLLPLLAEYMLIC